MNFKQSVETGLVAIAVFSILDYCWFASTASKLYKQYMKPLMSSRINFGAGAIFYFILAVCLVVFVLKPALDSNSLAYAVKRAGLLGVLSYGAFDLTLQSLFKKWPAKITLMELVWGFIVATVASVAAFEFAKHFIL